jgi:CheY-like chemotaxis protein
MDTDRRSITLTRPLTRVGRAVVVDDDDDTRDLYAEALRIEGFEVEPAADAVEALRAIAGTHTDIVIADYSISQIDGFELCRMLKANPKTDSIPVILVTGYSGPTWESRALASGAVRFLTKPLDPNKLVAVIREELSRLTGEGERNQTASR